MKMLQTKAVWTRDDSERQADKDYTLQFVQAERTTVGELHSLHSERKEPHIWITEMVDLKSPTKLNEAVCQ